MKIAVLKERREGEKRVAASPDTVKKFIELGAEVSVETGAGLASSIDDAEYVAAGAIIARSPEGACKDADVVLKVQRPLKRGEGDLDEMALCKKGAVLVGMLSPLEFPSDTAHYADAGITAFAMELVPRISRAQAMDVLSSQSNLAGYRAVIDAVAAFNKAIPMMMTAAGTVAPAKVLVLGAGVAGLQAIATAKRLGAVVSAFDVRPAVKEQVESLGAKFVEVPAEEGASAETKGGYAKEMSEDYKKRQRQLIHDTIEKQDIVITTALIPGRPAPELITEEMVKDMKEGGVIVDLAAAAGGNCPLTKADQVVEAHGITIIGHTNMPSRVAVDASRLYARNLLNFVALIVDKASKQIAINWDDEIIRGALLTRDGKVVNPVLQKKEAA
ncbi:MAG: Re/Si-specific NAD(P)(+) transhydrogenase subunit alpha [Alphaproteobacteria bacterium]|nr:Re/Si-specific NAD(P)(+) transhydrogenase subunit alpha [Alphaproteobacteria bacterium]